MAGLSLGLKSLMEITACTVSSDGTVSVDEGDSFEVMINPNSYKFETTVCFAKGGAQGEIGNRKQFKRINDGKVSFDLIIDGSGVVSLLADDVKTQIKDLAAVLGYDGSEHEPKHSRLVWGTLIFFGRMTSMTTNYTLFKPSGDPLRAKVSLNFTGFMTSQEESLKANRSSPDLSHLIEVKAGDSLPALCYQVYKDSTYYLEIAKINGLSNFRSLTPGQKLMFPPLA
ncbi:MAG: LysM peptidoglycan-binding domain-containing protein [Reinekea sp.]|jgi:hypothetical protein